MSTVLDDFSRYIVGWQRCPAMASADVTATLDQALVASGITNPSVRANVNTTPPTRTRSVKC